MKKQILLVSLLISSLGAQEIPSFQSLCQAGYAGCTQEDIPLYVMRNHLILNNDMTLDQIESTLTQWFQESPELRDYTLQWRGNLQPGDIPDKESFAVLKQIEAHILPFTPVDITTIILNMCKYYDVMLLPIDILNRCQEVNRVLRQLDVKQTLSDEQVELIAQILVIEIFSYCTQEDMMQELALLEKLLATYER